MLSEVGVNGSPNYLTHESNIGITLRTTNRSTTFTVADGAKNYTIEYHLNVLAWPASTLVDVSEAWLYIDLNKTTSARQYGLTKVAPVYGPTAPATPANDQHWFDTTVNNMKVYSTVSSSWTVVIRVFAGKYATNTTTTYPFGSQVGITSVNVVTGNIFTDGFGAAVKDSQGKFLTTEDVLLVSGAPSYAAKLEANISIAEAAEPIPAYHVVLYKTDGKIHLADYMDTGQSALSMSTENAATGESVTLILQGQVQNANWNWAEPNLTLWVGDSGQLVTVDPYSPTHPTYTRQPPVARTINSTTIVFNPGLVNMIGNDGPRGVKGDTGEIGPKGDKGDTGELTPGGMEEIIEAVAESGEVAQILRSTDLKDLPLNGGVVGNGLFPLTVKEEYGSTFSGQNDDVGDELPNVAPSHLAQCMMAFFTEESTNFSFHAPWTYVDEFAGRNVPLSYIRSTSFNSPTDLNLFEPMQVNAAGIMTFKYVGTQPLYTIIQGGITYLRRVNVTDSDRRLRNILYLKPVADMPTWENGQNKGQQFLGASLASCDGVGVPLFKDEFTDMLGKTNPTIEAALVSKPELFTEAFQGYLTPNQPDEEELPTDDPSLTPEQSANTRTTNWFDVTGNGILRLTPLGGVSTRRRVQVRTATNELYYASSMSANDVAEGLFRIPADAVQLRVYFRGPNDTATSMSIKVADASTNVPDVLGGNWIKKTLMVHKDIVFYPGVTYAILMMTTFYGTGGYSTFEYSNRIESGGLSFMFDASNLIKSKAKQLKMVN